ncbi:MAG: hypothetical protein OXD32_04720 [Endozoicomonadaceae bacterium]|nr:hypothetical protein [Endozoicomonadaceae bacterium]MCY4328478.1 hypothetical protein [Endozoicomonadaceae bacterium]
MKGQRQAVIVTLCAHLIPMFFWLGSAVVALVVMRKGFSKSIAVIIAGGLAALFWLSRGSSIEIITLTGVILMAHILRYSSSWNQTILVVVPLGVFLAWIVTTFDSGAFAKTALVIQQQTDFSTFSHLLPKDKSMNNTGQITQVLTIVLLKAYLLLCLVSMLLALVLARGWQAMLYKPGGFREEICKLRLPFLTSTALLFLWLSCYFSSSRFLHIVSPCILLPLLFAGIALIHGIITIIRPRNAYTLLVIAYLFTLLFYPAIIILACLDSFIDFRGRLIKKSV